MKIKEVVKQIIALKRKYHLTIHKYEWYIWALANGHIEFVVDRYNKVIGFLEWVRLNHIPTTIHDINLDYNVIKTGPILFVADAVAETKGVLNQMKRSGLAKNKDWQLLVWHNKIKDTFKIYKNKEIIYGD